MLANHKSCAPRVLFIEQTLPSLPQSGRAVFVKCSKWMINTCFCFITRMCLSANVWVKQHGSDLKQDRKNLLLVLLGDFWWTNVFCWWANLMYLTNEMYHRRALSYWFHIICNPRYLPSRPLLSPLCFMQLCPFLIIVTDRRCAQKDWENERESRDFVTAVFVCERLQLGGCGCGYLAYRSRPLPTPLYPPWSLSHVKGCSIQG